MKRIQLKESELVNLIQRVINEESGSTSKLKFNKQPRKKDAKTDVYNVVKGGTTIGQVKWYSRLRGYGFLPPSGDESEVTEFVKEISKTHRENNKKNKKKSIKEQLGPRWICQPMPGNNCHCISIVQPGILPDSFNTKKECEMDQSNCCGKRRKKPYSMPVNPIQDF